MLLSACEPSHAEHCFGGVEADPRPLQIDDCIVPKEPDLACTVDNLTLLLLLSGRPLWAIRTRGIATLNIVNFFTFYDRLQREAILAFVGFAATVRYQSQAFCSFHRMYNHECLGLDGLDEAGGCSISRISE